LKIPHLHFQNLLLLYSNKFRVKKQNKKWRTLLHQWGKKEWVPELAFFCNGKKAANGMFHNINYGESFSIKIAGVNQRKGSRITWNALIPFRKSYNITARDFGFAQKTGRVIFSRTVQIPGSKNKIQLSHNLARQLFDRKTGYGTIRIFASFKKAEETFRTKVITISRSRNATFLGRLMEVFNLPYIFGSSLIQCGDLWGPDARVGADCSNFLIYGLRRMGHSLSYVNPAQMKKYLHIINSVSGFKNGMALGKEGGVKIIPAQLQKGLFLHFGVHIVALYKDLGIPDRLDLDDLIIHQLGGFPEIVPLRKIKYIKKPFLVMKLRK